VRHHLIPAVPRRLHVVHWYLRRCSLRRPCRRFPRSEVVRRPRCPHLLSRCCHANRLIRRSSLRYRSCLRRLRCRNGFCVGSHVPIRVFSQVDSVSFLSFSQSHPSSPSITHPRDSKTVAPLSRVTPLGSPSVFSSPPLSTMPPRTNPLVLHGSSPSASSSFGVSFSLLV